MFRVRTARNTDAFHRIGINIDLTTKQKAAKQLQINITAVHIGTIMVALMNLN